MMRGTRQSRVRRDGLRGHMTPFILNRFWKAGGIGFIHRRNGPACSSRASTNVPAISNMHPHPLSRAAAVLWVAGLLAISAPAQNWPMFRGPQASGVGTGSPPTEWNVETGQNVKWKTRIPGLAHSSPIVWGDRIFLTTAVRQDAQAPELKTGWLNGSGDSPDEKGPWAWKVLCLDKRDGKILWEREATAGVPKFKRHLKATHANATPVTDGRRVVAFFGSEGLYCYDFEGKLLWKQDLGALDSGPYNAPGMQWGFASSPIIHDKKVIVQCDVQNGSFWAAFDLETGRELRRVKREEVSTWSTPAIYTGGGRTQLICNGWKHMGGYDLETGEEFWKLNGGGDVPVPTPLVAHGLIFLTNGHGRSPIYVIRPDAKGDITPKDEKDQPGVAWWKAKGGSYMPTPLIYENNFYVGDDNGRLRVYDARSGEERYNHRVNTRSTTFSASPVAADGKLYFSSEDGDVYVVKAGNAFEALAKNAMGETCMATPAIADGLLFIRTRDHLYCLGK